jgi:hypothetical protein
MNLAQRTRFNAERSIRSVHGEYAWVVTNYL